MVRDTLRDSDHQPQFHIYQLNDESQSVDLYRVSQKQCLIQFLIETDRRHPVLLRYEWEV